jgi:uncharacterized delta-60 repeat protein
MTNRRGVPDAAPSVAPRGVHRRQPYDPITASANGTRDSSFGSGGSVYWIHDIAEQVGALEVLGDGSMLVGASTGPYSSTDQMILKYTVDGALDEGFGTGGAVMLNFGPFDYAVEGIAVQDDGTIVAVGSDDDPGLGGRETTVVRLHADGSPDETFSGDGRRTIFLGDDTYPTGVVVQTDGKVVVGVGVYSESLNRPVPGLVRLTEGGAFDATFDGDGSIVLDPGDLSQPVGETLSGAGVVMQGDAFVVVVERSVDEAWAPAVMRLTSAGALDESFGDEGVTTLEVTSSILSPSAGLVLQGDGRIVFGGGGGDGWVARLAVDGGMDDTFGDEGITVLDGEERYDFVQDLAIQDDGKIVANGYASLSRLRANGTLDPAFGGDGWVKPAAYGVVVDTWSERIVTASHLRLIRYHAGPSRPDAQIKRSASAAFVGDGVYGATADGQTVTRRIAPGTAERFDVLVQDDAEAADRFLVEGCASGGAFMVSYRAGGEDVTAAVTSGRFKTRLLQQGEGIRLSMKVAAKSGAEEGSARTCRVWATSTGDRRKVDVVAATVSVA